MIAIFALSLMCYGVVDVNQNAPMCKEIKIDALSHNLLIVYLQ